MTPTRIMVVEDERIVALNLKQRLSRLGYEVTGLATSGRGALEEIERLPPDLVLMDIHIEGDMDGIEVASRIPPELHIPVVYLTAYSEESTLERARATTPYGFLLKPFTERELHATIQMALERRRLDVLVRESERRLEQNVEKRTAELTAANRELQKQIGERRKAEEALHQAQKMEALGQLTGGIAHDFNNLLQGIIGALTLMQKRMAKGRVGEAAAFVNDAMAAANRAATLIQRLLAYARRTPLAPKPVDCNELIASMAGLLRRTVGESVEVKLRQAEESWARCDAGQLESALLNLAINARDAMPAGGQLEIATSNVELDIEAAGRIGLRAGEYVCISMSDSGSGMSPDVLARAFEPFYTTKPMGQGTGLGLSMVYGFARQSEGHVKIDSELGRGTKVSLYLPQLARPGGADQAAPDRRHKDAEKAFDGEVVLVVEDDPAVRRVVLELLEDLGYSTLEATDGASGLEILMSDAKIDLLLTDVGLPSLNGRQLADAARERRPGLKVLFMTGYAENITQGEGFLAPGMRMITKPFELDALALLIKQMTQG